MPSQDALEINAALKQLRVALGTVNEAAAFAELDAVVSRIKAKRGAL
jgi:hypothetical protein